MAELLTLSLGNVNRLHGDSVLEDLLEVHRVTSKVKAALADGDRIANLTWRCLFHAGRQASMKHCQTAPEAQDSELGTSTANAKSDHAPQRSAQRLPSPPANQRKSLADSTLPYAPSADCLRIRKEDGREEGVERNGQEWTKEHTRAASSSSLKPGSLKELLTAILPMNLTSPSPVSLHPKPMASQADVTANGKATPPSDSIGTSSDAIGPESSSFAERNGTAAASDETGFPADISEEDGDASTRKLKRTQSSVSAKNHGAHSKKSLVHSTNRGHRPHISHARKVSAHHLNAPNNLADNAASKDGLLHAQKRPALAQRHSHTGHTSNDVVPRNTSFKSVRIAEGSTLLGGEGHIRRVSSSVVMAHSAAMTRSRSSDTGRIPSSGSNYNSTNTSLRSSRDQIAPLAGVLKRNNTATKLDSSSSKAPEAKAIVVPQVKASEAQTRSNSTANASLPRSVVRGFAEPIAGAPTADIPTPAPASMDVPASVASADYPLPPNTSPADRPLPIYALASGPSKNRRNELVNDGSSPSTSLPPPVVPPPTPAGSVLPSHGLAQAHEQFNRASLNVADLAEPRKGGRRNKFFIQSASVGSESEGEGSLSPAGTRHFNTPVTSTVAKARRKSSENNVPLTPSSLKRALLADQSETDGADEKKVSGSEDWEDEDSSGWGSANSSDDESPDKVARTKGGNAKLQGKGKRVPAVPKSAPVIPKADLFLKRVPTAPGPLARSDSRSALSQLLQPDEDVGLIRNKSAVGLVRTGSSKALAHNLPPHRGLQPSKSAAALPVLSVDGLQANPPKPDALLRSKHQKPTRVVSRSTIRPTMLTKTSGRLGGRPADVDMSDDSSSEDEAQDSRTAMSSGLDKAQEKELAAAIARQRIREMPAAIPQDPALTRRALIENEMSMSLRKGVLWERQSKTRLGNRQASNGVLPEAATSNGRAVPSQSRTAPEPRHDDQNAFTRARPRTPDPAPTGYFHAHGW